MSKPERFSTHIYDVISRHRCLRAAGRNQAIGLDFADHIAVYNKHYDDTTPSDFRQIMMSSGRAYRSIVGELRPTPPAAMRRLAAIGQVQAIGINPEIEP